MGELEDTSKVNNSCMTPVQQMEYSRCKCKLHTPHHSNTGNILSEHCTGERGRREGWMDGGLTSDTEEGISRCVGALCVGCHAAISPPAGEAHLRDGEHR